MIPSGRGAAMQRFLAQLKETEGDQATQEHEVGRQVPTVETTSITEGVEEIAIARPSGRGRGLRAAAEQSLSPAARDISYRNTWSVSKSESSAKGFASPAEAAPTGGRGRSALLAAFLAQQHAEDTAPGKPSSVLSQASSSRTVPPASSNASCPSRSSSRSENSSKSATVSPREEVKDSEPVIQRGSQGTPQEVVCNYINLDVERGKGVFEYNVAFVPSEDNLSMRTRMINQHLEELGGVKSYNGVKLLLSVDLKQERSFRCEHPAQGTPVTMTLTCKGPARTRDAAEVYNMLFRRIMVHIGLKNMGRKFFDPSAAVNIPQHKLEVWPGYVTAVQQYEGGIQLCCDASHRVMRTDNVHQVMTAITQANREKYRDEILKAVLGAVVLTRYNNRVYRVDDVDWDQSPMSTFQDQTGKNITFLDYYKNVHGLEIRDKTQPLLISRLDRKRDNLHKGVAIEVRMICLVPELCYITGLTDAIRNDFRIMRDLTQKLQLTPPQRYEGLCKFLDNVRNNKQSQELLQKWGLHVSKLPIRVMARVLPQETILYGNGSVTLTPGNSNWNINNSLLVIKELQQWAILYLSKDKSVADNFHREVLSCSAQMGMRIYKARMIQISDNRNDVFLSTLRSAIQPGLQLVVVFFPTLRSDRYAAVKKICCIEKPISSQVIQTKTLSRPDKARSITKKIVQQINCKLGGALWGVKIPFDKLMVCGMDVYHGPAGKNVSVMGFVATSDPLQTVWYSRVGFGTSNQEIADNLRICMLSALKKYHEGSGFYPDRIIMFRDGLSDGQINMTREFEVPQMLQSFKDLNSEYVPKLTVVVCQKRIMARMMAIQGSSGPNIRLNNPPPGSVMDNTITRHDMYDFFLVSQSSNRGTISPTHYIVAYDDGKIKPDHVQRMTYKMTHLYYNWTGTISIPAPAQYAHRLAQLVGQHLHKEVSSALCDKLYFL